ncbi:MAG: sulfatase [Candidatus Eisenbacteria bacterium]|nr:sulfatase [Candidatus Eisenbacteria bacterium]
MRNPLILASLLAASLVFSSGCGGGGEAGKTASIPTGPHPIILLDIGTLRADHLGAYGYSRPTSPNIDRLASESVVFEWAFSQAPTTAPSQASIFTGIYPSSHRMIDEGSRLVDEATTLAEALAERGYATAAFVDGAYLSPGFGFEQGFALYDNNQGGGLAAVGPKALDWMRKNAPGNFLLLIHTYDVHTPYDPPEPHRSLFLKGLAAPTEGFEATAEAMEAVRESFHAGTPRPLAEADLEYAKALYDGGIHYVDAWVGEFLDVLRETGLDKRATVVLFSDHGEEFQEHGSVLHEKLHTTVTRVPLLIRLPGEASAGRVEQFVETIDLMPTLLDLAGAPLPPHVQGESLVPLIRGEGRPPYIAFSESPLLGEQRAVALGGYRMILSKDLHTTRLYNLMEDPLELKDIAGDEPDRTDVLLRHLRSWEEKVELFSFEGGDSAAVGAETLEQLRSLGYVQ